MYLIIKYHEKYMNIAQFVVFSYKWWVHNF